MKCDETDYNSGGLHVLKEFAPQHRRASEGGALHPHTRMSTVPTPKELISKLHGTIFSDDAALELAMLEVFNPHQSAFPGESYRILIDIGRNQNWIRRAGPGWQVTVPDLVSKWAAVIDEPTKKPHIIESKETPVAVMPSPLSFREIHLLVDLNSSHTKVVRPNGIYNPDYDSLIAKGLVEHVNIGIPNPESDAIKRNLLEGKQNAIAAIVADKFALAFDLINDMMETEDSLHTSDWVWRLTAKGREFMAAQSDATSGWENA
jgi:hypothetical protein